MIKLFKNFNKKDVFVILLCVFIMFFQVWIELKLPEYVKKEVLEKNNIEYVETKDIEEYIKRKDENKRVCKKYGINFIELEYDNDRWCKEIKGLENEPERGKRCSICFYLRLKRVMEYAIENEFVKVTYQQQINNRQLQKHIDQFYICEDIHLFVSNYACIVWYLCYANSH